MGGVIIVGEIVLRAYLERVFHRRAWLAAVACVLLTSCSEGVLAPKGPVGQAEKTILLDATVIMLAVVVPVIVLTLTFAWWFRAGNKRARYRPDWEYSGRIEMIIWSIPALIVLFLGGIAWIGSHDLDPPRRLQSEKKALEVEVVSMDWKWLFVYPEQGIATVNELTVPVSTPIHFRLTSSSVMNSFFVPELGSQIYTMAGMTTELNLQADEAGIYAGRSAQFSGDGFSDMLFEVHATSDEEFSRWVSTAQQGSDSLDAKAYAGLLEPSHAHPHKIFSSVESGLFDRALMMPLGAAHAENH
jgi:cytochrome o ubiquinol oxidase subunit 2